MAWDGNERDLTSRELGTDWQRLGDKEELRSWKQKISGQGKLMTEICYWLSKENRSGMWSWGEGDSPGAGTGGQDVKLGG